MFEIENIQAMLNGGAVDYSIHYRYRMKERNIKQSEVRQALLAGEIIEEVPDDEPLPSILVLGYTDTGKPLHIVISVDDYRICLVTVYVPTLDIWETDYKTRKVAKV